MKLRTMLTAVFVLAMVATSAYAQFSVSSTPVTTIRSDGKAEGVGAVVLTATADNPNTGTITIDYGVPVDLTQCGTSTTGTNLTAGPCTAQGTTAVSVTITASPVAGNQLTVSGVRVDVSGSGISTLDANVSSTAIPIVAGETVTRVVNSTAASKSLGASTSVTALSNGNIPGTSIATVTIKEGFANAWTTKADEDGVDVSGTVPATNGYQLRLTVAGLPSGVTITPAIDTAKSNVTIAAPTVINSTNTSSVINITTSNLTVTETLVLNLTVSTTGATLPLATASFSASVTAFPAASSTTTVIPAFVIDEMDAGTVFQIAPATTNLLFEFATRVASANFDTGIAIANTSSDPFGTGSATATTGTVTFNLFNNDGSAMGSYTTMAGSAGSGLDANGQVAAGSTYSVLLSEVLSAAGITGDFTGYIIAVCNFTHAHGVAFTSNFTDFTQGTAALVIPDPTITARSAALAAGGEALGH